MFYIHRCLRILCGAFGLGLLLIGTLAACATDQTIPTTNTGGSPVATSTTSVTQPFKITAVDMAVSPTSIAGHACGSSLTVTYTATFHALAGGSGGIAQFDYTTNNGRSSTPATLTFAAGQTTHAYSFTWSGTLSSDNVNPGLGIIDVTSPNALISPSIKPAGTCSSSATPAPVAAFHVTSVAMTVSPSSLSGVACGTQKKVVYTATFHIVPDGPGGTIAFGYTTDNGRGNSTANLTVAPGQTTATYQFYWSGPLPADHTEPGNGGVITASPNVVHSALIAPTGACS